MPQTVFVTGASGFIAKHIVLVLLNRGHHVVGSLRSPARAGEVRDALRPHLADPGALDDRLRFATLDLTRDDGWTDALPGADALFHTASPFPIVQPENPDDLIRPAVDGTLRALRAAQASGIDRVVLTSSTAAVIGSASPSDGRVQDESDWTDGDDPTITAYTRSKTLAERAAWDFVRDQAPGMALTAINPAMVMGPPLDAHYGSSVGLVRRVLSGRDPMVPRLGMPMVDVRDVAEMHVRALERPETAGQRFLSVAGSLWFVEMGRILKQEFPDRRIPTRQAPDLLIRALGLFDKTIRAAVPSLGHMPKVANTRAQDVMGMEFIAPEDALRASARYLVENGLV